MKKCTGCHQIKPFDDFYKHKMGKNGLQSKCKSCYKQYRSDNHHKMVEYRKQYYRENKESICYNINQYNNSLPLMKHTDPN